MFLTCTFAYIVHRLVLSRYAHVLHLFFITDSQFQQYLAAHRRVVNVLTSNSAFLIFAVLIV